jgi:nicotinate phosphoribosyltransferase
MLDNDFYKFTMQQGVVRLFPGARVKYEFINRGKHQFPPGFAQALREAVDAMTGLKLTPHEKRFLQVACPYLDPLYLDFLEGYQYNPQEVQIEQHGTDLKVHIEGLWYRTILWEVPVMSLICELFYNLTHAQRISDDEIIDCTRKKIERYQSLGVKVAEFGTRRRYSYACHNLVVNALHQYGSGSFVGTSNVHLAMQYQAYWHSCPRMVYVSRRQVRV